MLKQLCAIAVGLTATVANAQHVAAPSIISMGFPAPIIVPVGDPAPGFLGSGVDITPTMVAQHAARAKMVQEQFPVEFAALRELDPQATSKAYLRLEKKARWARIRTD